MTAVVRGAFMGLLEYVCKLGMKVVERREGLTAQAVHEVALFLVEKWEEQMLVFKRYDLKAPGYLELVRRWWIKGDD